MLENKNDNISIPKKEVDKWLEFLEKCRLEKKGKQSKEAAAFKSKSFQNVFICLKFSWPRIERHSSFLWFCTI